MPTVDIPKVGSVDFPEDMPLDKIAKVSGDLHKKALTQGLLEFLQKDPAFQSMKLPDLHKSLAEVSAFLDKYPQIANAADLGKDQLTSLPAGPPSGTAAISGQTAAPSQPTPAQTPASGTTALTTPTE